MDKQLSRIFNRLHRVMQDLQENHSAVAQARVGNIIEEIKMYEGLHHNYFESSDRLEAAERERKNRLDTANWV